MAKLWNTTSPRWRQFRQTTERTVAKYGEYLFKHWPWKIIFVPLGVVGLVLYFSCIYMPQEEGGWVKMRKKQSERKERRKRLEYWQPQPLEYSRSGIAQRVTRWTGRSSRHPEPASQAQSAFLTRLPPEIRQHIFTLLLRDIAHRLHIQQSYRRFGHVQCHVRNPEQFPHSRGIMPCIWDQLDHANEERPQFFSRFALWNDELLQKLKHKPIRVSRSKNRHRPTHLLAPALTCKYMAQAYLLLLYSTPTFAFIFLSQFWLFSRTITPQVLARIRHLEFHVQFGTVISHELREDMPYYDPNYYQNGEARFKHKKPNPWREAWSSISKMEGLRDLRVELLCEYIDSGGGETPHIDAKWIEGRIFEPMQWIKLKGLKEFVVIVNWPKTAGLELRNEEVCFDLRRDVARRARGRDRDWTAELMEDDRRGSPVTTFLDDGSHGDEGEEHEAEWGTIFECDDF